MTALEAFQASGTAGVYVTVEGAEWFLVGGCQTGYAILVTGENEERTEQRQFEFGLDQEVAARIER